MTILQAFESPDEFRFVSGDGSGSVSVTVPVAAGTFLRLGRWLIAAEPEDTFEVSDTPGVVVEFRLRASRLNVVVRAAGVQKRTHLSGMHLLIFAARLLGAWWFRPTFLGDGRVRLGNVIFDAPGLRAEAQRLAEGDARGTGVPLRGVVSDPRVAARRLMRLARLLDWMDARTALPAALPVPGRERVGAWHA